MSDSDSTAEELPLESGIEAILRLRDRFESNWRAGARPRIEDYLDAVPESDRATLLQVLVRSELGLRLDDGPKPALDNYRKRFPGWSATIEAVFAAWASDPTASFPRPSPGDDPEPATDPDATGPRYRFLRHLDAGGLGVVSIAHDRELDREVALKEIRDEFAFNPQSRAYFDFEAKITGKLQHPGIVPIIGFGQYPDGRLFYTMNLIRGETLKEAILAFHRDHRDGGPPRERLQALRKRLVRFLSVCETMHFAHDHGVIHRDLKPRNIMLGKYGETLVIDWGVAKFIRRDAGDETESEGAVHLPSPEGIDPTRDVMGTYQYMSPEQAANLLDQIGPASDIFGLGSTLYCLLTGHAPFEGPTEESVREKALRSLFPPARQIRPDIPRPLEAICHKAMSREPGDRYRTALELADDIERWLNDEPVRAYRDPLTIRASRWARRHKPIVAVAVALLVTISAALAIDDVRVKREQARTEASFNLARKAVNKHLKALASGDLANLPQADPLRAKVARDAVDFNKRFVEMRPDDLDVQRDLAIADRELARIGGLNGKFREPLESYTEALDIWKGLAARLPVNDHDLYLLVMTSIDKADLLKMNDHPSDAAAETRAALHQLEPLLARSPANPDYRRARAIGLSNLAASLIDTGRFADAIPSCDEAVKLLATLADIPKPDPRDPVLMVMALRIQAAAIRKAGNPAAAAKAIQPAIRRASALVEAKRNRDARFLLGGVLHEYGQDLAPDPESRVESLYFFGESIRWLTLLHNDYPSVPAYRRSLAAAFDHRGALHLANRSSKKAKADCTLSRKLIEPLVAVADSLPGDHGLMGRTQANLAAIALAENQTEEARDLYREAIASLRSALKSEADRDQNRALLERCRADLERITSKEPTAARPD